MKKIMFSDKYGLTQAVLEGRKTMTRRIITCPKEFKGEWVAGFYVYKRQSDNAIIQWPCMYDADECAFDGGEILPKYKVGEVVAIAQSYKDAEYSPDKVFYRSIPVVDGYRKELASEQKGWTNKMFVCANLMPHRIRITKIRVERLQDISDEDCLKEGIWKANNVGLEGVTYWYRGLSNSTFRTPREAFGALIDKISGKGTWQSNPWVFAYEFELEN